MPRGVSQFQGQLRYTQRNLFVIWLIQTKFGLQSPFSDRFRTNELPFGTKSIGWVYLQSWFGLISPDWEDICPYFGKFLDFFLLVKILHHGYTHLSTFMHALAPANDALHTGRGGGIPGYSQFYVNVTRGQFLLEFLSQARLMSP